MGQLKCKLVSSHVMYNGLLCPWSTSIIFAILKRANKPHYLWCRPLLLWSWFSLPSPDIQKWQNTLHMNANYKFPFLWEKKKADPIPQLLLMFCSAQLDSSLKRTRSQSTNMSTLVCWVNGIVFHKGRDNSLVNCWPWRASWFYEQQ